MALSPRVSDFVAMDVSVVVEPTSITMSLFRENSVAMFDDGNHATIGRWVRLQAQPELGRQLASGNVDSLALTPGSPSAKVVCALEHLLSRLLAVLPIGAAPVRGSVALRRGASASSCLESRAA